MRRALDLVFRMLSKPRGIGEDTKRLPSLARALKTLVPRSVMREVIASSHDRRQWGVLAAAWVGVSEREFMSAAARELRMQYQDHVAAADLTIFGPRAREVLQSLRKIGASVVLEGERMVAFVVADPAEVRGVPWFDGTQTLSMAPWTEIAKALDLTERIILEAETNADRYEAMRRREQCERVVTLLIQEAVRHCATALDILTDGDHMRYQFSTLDGKIAVGGIHPQVIDSLIKYLVSAESDALVDPLAGRIVVRSMGSSSNLRLSWARSGSTSHPQTVATEPAAESVSIPKAEVEPVAVVPEVEALPATKHEHLPVLVVDDNPMFCRVLERMLKREGFEVSFEGDGGDALNRLHACAELLPKVVICDLHMPRMNGSEFVRRMKADPRLAPIPIIMLTSDDGVDAEVNALELGVDALIGKAKDPRVLCVHIARLARRGVLRKAA